MPDEGIYSQRDPIGIAGGNPTLYGYVWDSSRQFDVFGLDLKTKPLGNNANDFLDEAIKRQGLDNVPTKLKEEWIDGNYKYTVRVHPGNADYTNANTIYRVSRKSTILDANGQGTGLEYLGTDGKWYKESILKETNRDGTKNSLFNEIASKLTHIELN